MHWCTHEYSDELDLQAGLYSTSATVAEFNFLRSVIGTDLYESPIKVEAQAAAVCNGCIGVACLRSTVVLPQGCAMQLSVRWGVGCLNAPESCVTRHCIRSLCRANMRHTLRKCRCTL